MSLNLHLKRLRESFKPGVRITLFVVVFLPLTIALGFWQLERAALKEELQVGYLNQLTLLPVTPAPQTELKDFLRLRLRGNLLNQAFLVDNQTLKGQSGYWLVQILEQTNGSKWLVNRGFIAGRATRDELPQIPNVGAQVEVVGVVWPETGLVPLLADDPWPDTWPKRVQRLNVERMAQAAGSIARELRLEQSDFAEHPAPFVSVLREDKHLGYAATWFGLALALFVLFVYSGLAGQRISRGEQA